MWKIATTHIKNQRLTSIATTVMYQQGETGTLNNIALLKSTSQDMAHVYCS